MAIENMGMKSAYPGSRKIWGFRWVALPCLEEKDLIAEKRRIVRVYVRPLQGMYNIFMYTM